MRQSTHLPGLARAQDFRNTPIKVLIGMPAGSAQDVLTRAIADDLRRWLMAPRRLLKTMREDSERCGRAIKASKFSADD